MGHYGGPISLTWRGKMKVVYLVLEGTCDELDHLIGHFGRQRTCYDVVVRYPSKSRWVTMEDS